LDNAGVGFSGCAENGEANLQAKLQSLISSDGVIKFADGLCFEDEGQQSTSNSARKQQQTAQKNAGRKYVDQSSSYGREKIQGNTAQSSQKGTIANKTSRKDGPSVRSKFVESF
jgi:hypothetical protein